MGKHWGRFKWQRYSRYSGNLRDYWEDERRQPEHAREGVDDSGGAGIPSAGLRPATGQRQEMGADAVPIPPGQCAISRRVIHLRGVQLPWLRRQGRPDQAADGRERSEPC